MPRRTTATATSGPVATSTHTFHVHYVAVAPSRLQAGRRMLRRTG
jgi:hypothetical protein